MTLIENHSLVHLQQVDKHFRSPAGVVRALEGVDLRVRPGEFVGVRGPSGSGKSTLIHLITGIDRPTGGSVRVAGQALEALSEDALARFRGRHVGIIFQFFQLLPTLTALENVLLPMALAGGRRGRARETLTRARALLAQVGALEQAERLPGSLSGGQQQRVAIARALANDPPLLVADEPTGNLDSRSAGEIFDLFEALAGKGKTFIVVTHDAELARRMPRVVEVRDGRLHE
jgi:putative ABC transport system ATP-binding protein